MRVANQDFYLQRSHTQDHGVIQTFKYCELAQKIFSIKKGLDARSESRLSFATFPYSGSWSNLYYFPAKHILVIL